jgi:hypothetical protein
VKQSYEGVASYGDRTESLPQEILMDIVSSLHVASGQLPHPLIAMWFRQSALLLEHLAFASVAGSDQYQ